MDNSYLNFIGYESQDFFPKIEMGLEEAPSFQNPHDKVSNDFMFSLENEQQDAFSKLQGINSTQDVIQSILTNAFNPNALFMGAEKPQKFVPFQISKHHFENYSELIVRSIAPN